MSNWLCGQWYLVNFHSILTENIIWLSSQDHAIETSGVLEQYFSHIIYEPRRRNQQYRYANKHDEIGQKEKLDINIFSMTLNATMWMHTHKHTHIYNISANYNRISQGLCTALQMGPTWLLVIWDQNVTRGCDCDFCCQMSNWLCGQCYLVNFHSILGSRWNGSMQMLFFPNKSQYIDLITNHYASAAIVIMNHFDTIFIFIKCIWYHDCRYKKRYF